MTDERVAQAGMTSPVAGFYPSLHLNPGECYRKLGDLDVGREHLERGHAAVGSLGDDGLRPSARCPGGARGAANSRSSSAARANRTRQTGRGCAT